MSRVVVTGGSGFIAAHCILKLLDAGHEVTTTVRSLSRAEDVREMLRKGGQEPGERLAFKAADLSKDDSWAEAVEGADYVLHVASPFPAGQPKDHDELIVPARDGALRVLAAARDAGVKRVVMTSSFAAVGYGAPSREKPFDEADWTDPSAPGLGAYVRSKTIAERAAWDFMAREGGALELSVVNPVGVFGPVLGRDYATSILLVKRLLDGAMPGCPRLWFGVVDVRDVADLHILAMTHPAAKGERFLATARDFVTLVAIARALKARLGPVAARVPTRELPDWVLHAAAVFDPAVKLILPELGKPKNGTSAKARNLLGWFPRRPEDAVVATGESLIREGVVKAAA